ncbi:thiamine-phosphate kinase [bacterium]|nr:thiamine-phosphate kinase [bacterium]
MTGEFELIRKLLGDWRAADDVEIGSGDDASGFRLPSDPDILYIQTTDLLVENVHFRQSWGTPRQLGWKSLAVNLSDIAAMGGTPCHLHLSLAVPPSWTEPELIEFMSGVKTLGQKYGVSLLGGDLSKSNSDLMISATVGGTVRRDQVIRRSGAQPGDAIWVSGTLGDAAVGLKMLEISFINDPNSLVLQNFLTPQPEVELGLLCAQSGLVHAMIDVSDGLAGDLAHILDTSSTGAVINAGALPIPEKLQAIAEHHGCDMLELALTGGEDYRLLGCTPTDRLDEFFDRVKSELNRELHCIGSITAEAGLRLVHPDGRIEEISPTSWDHFG